MPIHTTTRQHKTYMEHVFSEYKYEHKVTERDHSLPLRATRERAATTFRRHTWEKKMFFRYFGNCAIRSVLSIVMLNDE